tara:strand:+ start:939 stop:1604 length:666 start_codon:yes stop_codon:yes gene_type:complete
MIKKKKPINRLKEKVKTAKKRKASSTRWLQRQLNDPYVKQAQSEGRRSRAAFKLIEIDKKFKLLKAKQIVLDLGAAPGSWTEVIVERTRGRVMGVDKLPMDAIDGAELLQFDLMDQESFEELKNIINGKVDLVLSDMASETTGHKSTDHIRTQGLAELAADYAVNFLNPGGAFCSKVFHGGAHDTLLKLLKENFTEIKHYKPPASRKESPENYVIAKNFKK